MATPQRIRSVANIVLKHLEEDSTIVIFSAFGGVTNDLLHMAELAAKEDEGYKGILEKNEKRHIDAVRDLIPIQLQSSILSKVKTVFNRLETLYEGVFLLNELSNKTKHVIAGFGEILCSIIVAEYFKSLKVQSSYLDSRELIVCKNNNEKVQVSYDII